MTTLILNEERAVILVSGLQQYQVRCMCTASGELPDTGIFLYQIIDQADPLQDVFIRIVEIADFDPIDSYLDNRLAATLRGDTYWRSPALSKIYSSIDLAKAAVTAIFDRVNALVIEYETYITDFKTTPSVDVVFPASDVSLVQSLKDDYDAAYTDYQAKLTAQTTAQDALTAAQAYSTTAQAELQNWLTLNTLPYFLGDQQYMNEAYAASNSSRRKLTMGAGGYVSALASDVGLTVVQAVSGNTGILIAFNNATREWWVTPRSSTDVFDLTHSVSTSGGTGVGTPGSSDFIGGGFSDVYAGVVHIAGTGSYILSQINGHTATVSIAQTGVTTAQIAYNQSQGDLQTAYTALESSYNAVKAVCPNWSPTYPFPPVPY